MRTLYHVHSEYIRDDKAAARHAVAKSTWINLYSNGNWVEVPAPDEIFTRNSKTVVGDTRVLPFVRDLIDFCSVRCKTSDDIIVLTNDDTCFAESLSGQIENAIQNKKPAYAYRWDFRCPITQPLVQADMSGATWYSGSDLFVFTNEWWMENRLDFPDLIMACEYWDCILRQMIKRSGGMELQKAIYHEWHDSLWQQPGFRQNNPGQKHNVEEANRWFARNNSDQFDCDRPTWCVTSRQEKLETLFDYERYAKIYWSGIADSAPKAITPGPQWAKAEEDAGKLLEGIDPKWGAYRAVMEFGCGEGRLAVPLARKFGIYRGVDIAPRCIERCRQLQIPNAHWQLLNGVTEINIPQDCIVSWTVFMHMPHTIFRVTLEYLVSMLGTGGYLAFHLSNQNREERLRYNQVDDANLWEGRWYPQEVAEKIITSAGLRIIRAQGDGDGVWLCTKDT